jgi:hypothetical protein
MAGYPALTKIGIRNSLKTNSRGKAKIRPYIGLIIRGCCRRICNINIVFP